jgi:hypothetical protein
MRARTILLGLALAGCWNGGGGIEVTSLDRKLVIGDLNDAQFSRLCQDIDHWNQAQFGSAQFRAASCEIEAATTLRQQFPSPVDQHQACRDQAHQCQSTGGSPHITPRCQRDPGGCPLLVAEVEKCLFEIAYDMNIVLCTAPVCDDICGIVDARAVEPPSCAAIAVACPGLRFTRPSFEAVVKLEPCTGAGPATKQCVWR